MERTVAEIVLDHNLTQALDYAIPEHLQTDIYIGMRVVVPLRGKVSQGTVSQLKTTSPYPLVPLLKLLPETSLSKPLWKLAQWMSRYYACSLRRILVAMTPSSVRSEALQQKKSIAIELRITREKARALCAEWQRKKPAQARILENILQAKHTLFLRDMEASPSSIKALVEGKVIQCVEKEELELEESEFFPALPKALNEEQSASFQKISASIEAGHFATHLLYGVTGSGKTEVYLQAIQKALDLKKGALFLVPEIALTTQTIERLAARFGLKLAILHHRRSITERKASWEALKRGEISIAIGARSAIFSPVSNLGLIVVDEEHDLSYKSQEMPTYHARDIAVMRGQLEQCTVILGSATPALESFYNSQKGKYQFHTLSKRATQSSLPKIRIIDMLQAYTKAGGFTHFSAELLDAMRDRYEKGEQTLLLLNRRGTHRLQICMSCRHVLKCPHCDLSLTYHRVTDALRCHLCDYKTAAVKSCPACSCHEAMKFQGFGTEHVQRSLHAIFPELRTLRMDRDTTTRKGSHEEIFHQFRAHKADVLIGTQMIAKGLHFPSTTLVGVLNADAALQVPDFRSGESLFQLIAQVAGRAGRAELAGEVILQTFLPQHPLLHIAIKQDFDAFYTQEMQERELFCFPPFCRLCKLVFSNPDLAEAEQFAKIFFQKMQEKELPETYVLPPTPAGHPKIKDLYRIQFLIKTKQMMRLSDALTSLCSEMTLPRNMRLLIDIDAASIY